MNNYISPWATRYSADDFLIQPQVEPPAGGQPENGDASDEEMLRILCSLDNGSSIDSEEAVATENTEWEKTVKEFRAAYNVSSSRWKEILKRTQEIKRKQPHKKFSTTDLVAIAQKLKKQNKSDKQETD